MSQSPSSQSSTAAGVTCSVAAHTCPPPNKFQFPRPPRSVLVVKKRGPGSDEVRHATMTLVEWMITQKQCAVWMEHTEAEDIARLAAKEKRTIRVRPPPQHSPGHGHPPASARSSSPCTLPAGLYSLSHPVATSEIDQIDFCVTMGGDGTVLNVNCLLNSIDIPIPPLLSFAMGSLGFLTNILFDEHVRTINRVLNAYARSSDSATSDRGGAASATAAAAAGSCAEATAAPASSRGHSHPQPSHSSPHASSSPKSGSASSASFPSSGADDDAEWLMLNPRTRLHCEVFRRTAAKGDGQNADDSTPSHTKVGSYTCLNELLVHRSSSPFLASIDIQLVENHAPSGTPFYVTTVAGDGLMASTPTGSTAYNMAAGGPLLAPECDSFVLTPVSPHSLSFRPICLSSCAVVRFVIAANSRLGITEKMVDGLVSDTPSPEPQGAGEGAAARCPSRRYAAICSCDGHFQVLMGPGDYVQFTAARYPLDHINLNFPMRSNESLWLQNLTHKLHWSVAQGQRSQEERNRIGGSSGSSSSSGGQAQGAASKL